MNYRDPSPKFDPEEYQRLLLANEATLGKHYVISQLEWSEFIFEQRLAAGQVASAPAPRLAGGEAADFAGCASSGFSSGGVVAPQIADNCVSPARKSHG